MSMLESFIWMITFSAIVLELQAQFIPVQKVVPQSQSAASLSNAQVGFYSRRGPFFGDTESAASLSGAPVGLYHRRHWPPLPAPLRRIVPALPILNRGKPKVVKVKPDKVKPVKPGKPKVVVVKPAKPKVVKPKPPVPVVVKPGKPKVVKPVPVKPALQPRILRPVLGALDGILGGLPGLPALG